MNIQAGEVVRFADPDGSEHKVELATIYWRLRDGTYGLKGTGTTPTTGSNVRVLLRDGEVRIERVGRVVFADPGKVWIATNAATSKPALSPQRTTLADADTDRTRAMKAERDNEWHEQALRIAEARSQMKPRERMSVTGHYHGHGGRCRSCNRTATHGAYCASCAAKDDH